MAARCLHVGGVLTITAVGCGRGRDRLDSLVAWLEAEVADISGAKGRCSSCRIDRRERERGRGRHSQAMSMPTAISRTTSWRRETSGSEQAQATRRVELAATLEMVGQGRAMEPTTKQSCCACTKLSAHAPTALVSLQFA
jgi:hypothetical protein